MKKGSKVYLIEEDTGKIRLFLVRPELEIAFQERYMNKVIVAGSNIQEVIIKLSLLLNKRFGET